MINQMSKIKNQKHNSKIKNFLFLILVLTFALCTLRLKQAYAQASRSFTISPPSIKFSLKPGQKAEKIIKITNNSSEPIEFVANIVDFVVKDKDGTPELIPAGVIMDNKFAASSWSAVLPDSFMVQPGKKETVTLYLQVPGDSRPGGRYLSVAFRPIGGGNLENSGAAVNTVVGSLVYLTVEGKMKEGARVTKFSAPPFSEYGPIDITTEIQNSGDLHIAPKGTIVVKGLFGGKYYSGALQTLNIFPGTSRIYTNQVPKKWLVGRFRASLTGYYGTNNNLPLNAGMVFWVIPYKIIGAILLGVTLTVVLILHLQKKQEEKKEVKE